MANNWLDDPQNAALFNQKAQQYGVPPDYARQVLMTESHGDPNAASPAGAQGLMQLMPPTARAYNVNNALDPIQNIDGGLHALGDWIKQSHGNLAAASAGNNGGTAAWRAAMAGRFDQMPAETQGYVQKTAYTPGAQQPQQPMADYPTPQTPQPAYFQMPSGKYYTYDANQLPPAEAEAMAMMTQPKEFLPPTPPQPASLVGTLEKSALGLGYSTLTGIESMWDPEGAARDAVQNSKDLEKRFGPDAGWQGVSDAYKEGGFAAGAKQFITNFGPHQLAENAPMLAAAMAGGAAGSVIPGLGTGVGAAIGAGLALFPSMLSSNIQRQAEEQTEKDPNGGLDIAMGPALAATAGQSVANVGALRFMGGKFLAPFLKIAEIDGVPAAEAKLLQAAQQSLKQQKQLYAATQATTAGAVAKGAAIMPADMVMQTVLSRWQAGKDLLSPDAMDEYGQTAAGAAVVGSVFGGLMHFGHPEAAQARLDQWGKLQQQALEQHYQADTTKIAEAAPGSQFRAMYEDYNTPENFYDRQIRGAMIDENIRDQYDAMANPPEPKRWKPGYNPLEENEKPPKPFVPGQYAPEDQWEMLMNLPGGDAHVPPDVRESLQRMYQQKHQDALAQAANEEFGTADLRQAANGVKMEPNSWAMADQSGQLDEAQQQVDAQRRAARVQQLQPAPDLTYAQRTGIAGVAQQRAQRALQQLVFNLQALKDQGAGPDSDLAQKLTKAKSDYLQAAERSVVEQRELYGLQPMTPENAQYFGAEANAVLNELIARGRLPETSARPMSDARRDALIAQIDSVLQHGDPIAPKAPRAEGDNTQQTLRYKRISAERRAALLAQKADLMKRGPSREGFATPDPTMTTGAFPGVMETGGRETDPMQRPLSEDGRQVLLQQLDAIRRRAIEPTDEERAAWQQKQQAEEIAANAQTAKETAARFMPVPQLPMPRNRVPTGTPHEQQTLFGQEPGKIQEDEHARRQAARDLQDVLRGVEAPVKGTKAKGLAGLKALTRTDKVPFAVRGLFNDLADFFTKGRGSIGQDRSTGEVRETPKGEKVAMRDTGLVDKVNELLLGVREGRGFDPDLVRSIRDQFEQERRAQGGEGVSDRPFHGPLQEGETPGLAEQRTGMQPELPLPKASTKTHLPWGDIGATPPGNYTRAPSPVYHFATAKQFQSWLQSGVVNKMRQTMLDAKMALHQQTQEIGELIHARIDAVQKSRMLKIKVRDLRASLDRLGRSVKAEGPMVGQAVNFFHSEYEKELERHNAVNAAAKAKMPESTRGALGPAMQEYGEAFLPSHLPESTRADVQRRYEELMLTEGDNPVSRDTIARINKIVEEHKQLLHEFLLAKNLLDVLEPRAENFRPAAQTAEDIKRVLQERSAAFHAARQKVEALNALVAKSPGNEVNRLDPMELAKRNYTILRDEIDRTLQAHMESGIVKDVDQPPKKAQKETESMLNAWAQRSAKAAGDSKPAREKIEPIQSQAALAMLFEHYHEAQEEYVRLLKKKLAERAVEKKEDAEYAGVLPKGEREAKSKGPSREARKEEKRQLQNELKDAQAHGERISLNWTPAEPLDETTGAHQDIETGVATARPEDVWSPEIVAEMDRLAGRQVENAGLRTDPQSRKIEVDAQLALLKETQAKWGKRKDIGFPERTRMRTDIAKLEVESKELSRLMAAKVEPKRSRRLAVDGATAKATAPGDAARAAEVPVQESAAEPREPVASVMGEKWEAKREAERKKQADLVRERDVEAQRMTDEGGAQPPVRGPHPWAVAAERAENAREDAARAKAWNDLKNFDPLINSETSPYPGAKKIEGFWADRSGQFVAYPAGGHGFVALPVKDLALMKEFGLGHSHYNRHVADAIRAFRRGENGRASLNGAMREVEGNGDGLLRSEITQMWKMLREEVNKQKAKAIAEPEAVPLPKKPMMADETNTPVQTNDLGNPANAAMKGGKRGLTRQGDGPVASPVHYDEAARRIAALQAALGDKLEITHGHDGKECPPELAAEMAQEGTDPNKERAWISKDGKRLWINNNAHGSIGDLEATLAHEIIGHRQAIPIIDKAWEARGGFHGFALALDGSAGGGVDRLLKDLGIDEQYKGADLDTKVKEAIATMEERRPGEGMTETIRRVWKEIVGAVRQWLQDHGLVNFAQAKDYDIYNMLRQARNADHLREANLGDHGLARGAKPFEGPPLSEEAHDAFYGKPATQYAETKTALGKLVGSFNARVFNRDKPIESVLQLLRQRGKEGDEEAAKQAHYYLILARRASMMTASTMSEGAPELQTARNADGSESRLKIVKATGARGDAIQEALKEGKRDPKAFDIYIRAEQMLGLGPERIIGTDAYSKLPVKEWERIRAEGRADPVFQKARKAMADLHIANMEFMKDAGNISPEELGQLEAQIAGGAGGQKYFPEAYAPLYREKDGYFEAYYGVLDRAFRVGGLKDTPELKRLLGSDMKPVNLMTGILMNTTLINRLATSNMATRGAVHAMEALGAGKFVDPSHKGPDILHYNDWDKASGKRMDRAFQVYDTDLRNGDSLNAQQTVQALEGLPQIVPAIVRTLSTPAQWMRHATLASPFYMMRMLMKEPLAMWIGAGADTNILWRTAQDFLKTSKSFYGGAENPLRKRAMQLYLVSGGTLMGEPESVARELMKHDPSTWKRALARMEELGIASDSAMRNVYIDQLMKKGFNELDAFIATSKNTVDFFQKGLSPQLAILRQMVPFFSSQLAAIDTLIKSFRGQLPYNEKLQIQQKLFQRGAILAGGTILYSMLSKDQPYYQQASDDDKYGNWMIPFKMPGVDDPVVMRVPIPYEYAYLFKIFPEAMVNRMAGDGTNQEMFGALKNMAVNTMPGVVPQGIKPVIEAWTNTNFYTGRPLVSEELQKKSQDMRYTDYTSEIAKRMGFELGFANGTHYGLSPIWIEHFASSLSGPLGLAMMHFVSWPMDDRPDRNLSQIPALGSMFQSPYGQRYIERLESILANANAHKATYDELIKERRPDDARAFMQDPENARQYELAEAGAPIQKQLNELRQARSALRWNKNVDPEERRQRINAITEQESRLSKSFGQQTSGLSGQ